MLFKRNRIPFTIPDDARELSEEEMIQVNGGAEEKKESQESKSESVTVKSGNTLSGIVSDYNKANGTNYTVSDVAKNSGISNPDVIYPGQEIKFGASSSTNSGSSSQGNNQTSVQSEGSKKNISNPQSNTNVTLTATEKSERNCTCSTERCKINYGAGDMTVTERIASEKEKSVDGKIEETAVKGNAYNPNDIDSDKRYNARDYKGEHIMTVKYDDKENFGNFANYYLSIGRYGTAGTKSYDGIGLTDRKGNVIHVLRNEKAILTYGKYLNPDVADNSAEALFHYIYGDGYPVELGETVFQDIVIANSKNEHYENIVSGRTTSSFGNYKLHMAGKDCQDLARDFFVGKTRIDYNITTYDDYSEVSFTASYGDGFWDIFGDDGGDKMGPKKDIPGCSPYPFISRSWTETFPNPSKMNWLNEN